jgi:anti-sigma factor RsiW
LLLAVSGELSDAARRQMMAEVAQDPQLNAEYQDLREQMELLGSMAIPEPSAQERREIPAAIKECLRAALQEKKAPRRVQRRRYAAAVLGALVVAALLVFRGEHARAVQQDGQVAALHATIEQIEAGTLPRTLPLALTDTGAPVPLSVPTLAHLRDQENMLWNMGEKEDEGDPSAPPGS